jgi:hypothetical protein
LKRLIVSDVATGVAAILGLPSPIRARKKPESWPSDVEERGEKHH